MVHSTLPSPDSHEDLPALRRAIEKLADHCAVDLACPHTLRQCLDGQLPTEATLSAQTADLEELRTMIVLLYRLENSTSEDLGHSGLQRLWQQHREVMRASRRHELRSRGALDDCCRP